MDKVLIALGAGILIIAGASIAFFSMSERDSSNISFQGPELGFYRVNIENFDYSPREIRIKRGESVVWTNKDSVEHTVTFRGGLGNSSLLTSEENYSMIFTETGEYNYYCSPHPNMHGKIIVS